MGRVAHIEGPCGALALAPARTDGRYRQFALGEKLNALSFYDTVLLPATRDKGESPGPRLRVHKGAWDSRAIAELACFAKAKASVGESQPLPHGRDPGRCTAPSEQPTNTPDPAAACVERNRSNSDARSATSRMATQENSCAVASVHLTGDGLKEAVVLRCLSRRLTGHLTRKELIEKYASLKVNDVSIELSSVHQKQENLLKDAMAQAIADTLCLRMAADDKKSQMYPAGPLAKLQRSAYMRSFTQCFRQREVRFRSLAHQQHLCELTQESSQYSICAWLLAIACLYSTAFCAQGSPHRCTCRDTKQGSHSQSSESGRLSVFLLRFEGFQASCAVERRSSCAR